MRGPGPPEELGVQTVRRVPDEGVPRPEALQIGAGVLAHTEIAIEESEEEPRAERPGPAPPAGGRGAEVAVAAVQRGDGLPTTGPERAHERDGMPPRNQRDVGSAL